MDFTQFGWRDGVLLIAVGIGVYVAIMLLRLLRIGKQKVGHLDLPNHAPTLFGAADPASSDSPAEAAVATTEYELPFHFSPPSTSAAVPPEPSQGIPSGITFAETLGASRFEQEVRQLRAEVAALREELLDLQAAHRVAPQYADAMALARRGFDARGIADHCGIALGEAELIMALARGADDPQAEDNHGVAGSPQDAMRPHWGQRTT